jgi:hypothetical protein
MYKDMPAKKNVKATIATQKTTTKAMVKSKTEAKPSFPKKADKKTVKETVKSVLKNVIKTISKNPSKPVKTADKKPAKVAAAKVATPAVAKTRAEKAQIDTGGTLLEMAKEEMSKVNAPIAEALEKAEKTGKFKPIKVERGNLADEKEKWQELYRRYGKEKAVNYKMSDEFQALKPINHKILGWGFVLTNENNRLEILFENGIKVLISNYK